MAYRIEFSSLAAKQLRKLPSTTRRALAGVIDALAGDPRPRGCKKLKGRHEYRIRANNFRILYTVDDGMLKVLVLVVADRKEVYR